MVSILPCPVQVNLNGLFLFNVLTLESLIAEFKALVYGVCITVKGLNPVVISKVG